VFRQVWNRIKNWKRDKQVLTHQEFVLLMRKLQIGTGDEKQIHTQSREQGKGFQGGGCSL